MVACAELTVYVLIYMATSISNSCAVILIIIYGRISRQPEDIRGRTLIKRFSALFIGVTNDTHEFRSQVAHMEAKRNRPYSISNRQTQIKAKAKSERNLHDICLLCTSLNSNMHSI